MLQQISVTDDLMTLRRACCCYCDSFETPLIIVTVCHMNDMDDLPPLTYRESSGEDDSDDLPPLKDEYPDTDS